MTTHASGGSTQNWLWAAPAKHSTRQIAEMFERIEFLRALGVDQHLIAIPDGTLRRYARRMASRAPSAGVRIKEPVRTIEVSCFLRYCLLAAAIIAPGLNESRYVGPVDLLQRAVMRYAGPPP